MEIRGKYNTAHIFTDNIDEAALSQIYNMLNIPCFDNCRIAIMSDVHLGKGSVVGFTMTFNNFVNPSVVGVDIGCGIIAYNIGQQKINLKKFDHFIHSKIPAGSQVHDKSNKSNKQYSKETNQFEKVINKVASNEHQRILLSIGTLGGGNHFIELDKDEKHNIWLVIHTGSRNFGLQVCNYHQQIAKQRLKNEFKGAGAYHGIEYLALDNGGEEYLHDMDIAQKYAELNREVIAKTIIEEFFSLKLNNCEKISSIHNYINFKDNIVRKGAISAHKGEPVIIPLNMRDGCIIGKGNKLWNFSAPHGAGRILRRSESRELLSLEEYQETMKGIYSSCINRQTLDESPMVYKDSNEIQKLIAETVTIESIIKPIYNFKG
ncbi:hypothetical protein TI05_02765 [Achromatium sp. WMS3]|nr:hypothetical protein TI05_02765 [Achromatium sp. WMS3]